MNGRSIAVQVPGRHVGWYQPGPITGWDTIGEVTHRGRTGALVQHKQTKVYCRANAWHLSHLPQLAVINALAALRAPSQKGKRGT